jgi:hypothetical protein
MSSLAYCPIYQNPAKILHAVYIPVTAPNLKTPSLATVPQGQSDLVDAIPAPKNRILKSCLRWNFV